MGLLDNWEIKLSKVFINHFLGAYLDQPLQDQQIHKANGSFICRDIHLNNHVINHLLAEQFIPLEVKVAYIEQISVSIPWKSTSNASTFEIYKLEIELHPLNRSHNMNADVVLDSMISSMTKGDHSMEDSMMASFQSQSQTMSISTDELAKLIDSLIANISVTLKDTRIRLEYSPSNIDVGIGLDLSIKHIFVSKGSLSDEELIDDNDAEISANSRAKFSERNDLSGANDSPSEASSVSGFFTQRNVNRGPSSISSQSTLSSKPRSSSYSNFKASPNTGSTETGIFCKHLRVCDLTLHWDLFPHRSSDMTDSTTPERVTQVELALLSGQQNIRVVGRASGSPRLKVDLDLSPMYVFLSPDCINWMSLLCQGFTSQNTEEACSVVDSPCGYPGMEPYRGYPGMKKWGHPDRLYSAAESQVFQSCTSVLPPDNSARFYPEEDNISDITDLTLGTENTAHSLKGNAHFEATNDGSYPSANYPNAHRDWDRTSELISVGLSVRFLSLVLLHEEPKVKPKPEDLQPPDICDLSELKRLASRHFGQARRLRVGQDDFDMTGLTEAEFLKKLRHEMAEICSSLDHLSFLCRLAHFKVVKSQSSVHEIYNISASIHSLEVVETLYGNNQAKGITIPDSDCPEFSELLTFNDANEDPSLKVSLEIDYPCGPCSSLLTSSSSKKTIKRLIRLELGQCSVEVDRSVTDRIHRLLNNRVSSQFATKVQTLNTSALFGTQNNFHSARHYSASESDFQSSFFAEPNYGHSSSCEFECDTTVVVDTKCLQLVLLFPVPDLRKHPVAGRSHQLPKLPWWRRNLRDERVVLRFESVAVNSKMSSNDTVLCFEINCVDLSVNLIGSSFPEPVPVLKISQDGPEILSFLIRSQPSGGTRFVPKTCPPEDSLVEYVDLPDFENSKSSPFVTQRTHSESATVGDGTQKKNLWPQETHFPADSEGMRTFRKNASEYCLLTLELEIPSLVLNLENKKVLDVLYERICCDLVLWESLVPPEDPLMCDNQGIPLNIYGLPETLLNSKSSLSGGGGHDTESDFEDEVTSSPYQSGSFPTQSSSAPDCFGRKAGNSIIHVTENPSFLCCNVSLKRAVIRSDLCTESQSSSEILLTIHQGNIFFENGHNGHPELAYCTIQSNRIGLYQGVKRDSHLPLGEYLLESRIAEMNAVIEPAPTGLKYAFNSGYTGEEMLLVALEFREKKRKRKSNDKAPSPIRQDIRVAVRFSEALYHHRIEKNSSWITGLQSLLTLRDPPIDGYLPPETVSTVHCHMNRLSALCSPPNLTLCALLTCQNVTLTSNVYLNSDSSIFHVFLENSGLFLASLSDTAGVPKPPTHNRRLETLLQRDVRSHFVCVAELDHFELSIAFLDTFGKMGPTGMDIRCLNNMLTLHLCADSLDALIKIIQHINQDHTAQHSDPPVSTSSEQVLPDVTGQHNQSLAPSVSHKRSQQLSDSDKKELQNLITDAIESSLEQSSDGSSPEDEDDNDDFVLVSDMQLPMKEDIVECLLKSSEQLVYNSNHFHHTPPKMSSPFSDPEKYPSPVYAFTIYDASLVCKIYAGWDFHNRERDTVASGAAWSEDALSTRNRSSASNLLHSLPKETRSRNNSSRSIGTENHPSQSLSQSLQKEGQLTASTPVISGIKFQGGGKPLGAIRFSKKHSDIISLTSLSCPSSSHKLAPSHSANEPLTSQSRQKWCQAGGAGRRTEKSMEFQICKLNYRFSKFPETSSYAARHILTIRQLEIRDLIDTSNINKLLCLHNSDSIPYNEKAPMILFKILTERVSIDESIDNLESDIKVSIQPLWLNIDQDALEFFMEFCDNFNNDPNVMSSDHHVTTHPTATMPPHNPQAPHSSSYPILSMNSTTDNSLFVSTPPPPVSGASADGRDESDETVSDSDSEESNSDDRKEEPSLNTSTSLDPSIADSPSNTMFIRKFTFTPDLHVRIDYCGKKFGRNSGALMGLATGLTRLNNSEVVIRRLHYERGFSGVDRLVQAIVADWSADIPIHIRGILSGLGPMHEVIQIATGIRDLFVMPVKQYNEDGGVLRGLKGGARSFSTSTLWALLELSSQGVRFIQFMAENAYDFVTPGPSLRRCKPQLRPPANLPEGMSNAALAVRSGFTRVAVDISRATNHPDKEGIAGTMGELLRQVGPTIVTPIYVLTEALMQILVGLRTQIRPLSKKEDERKYKDTHGL